MKNEKLYQGMTEGVAKRYLEIRKTVDESLDRLRGVSQLCEALKQRDGEAIQIEPYCMSLISEVTEHHVSMLYQMLDEEFVNSEDLKEALEES